MEKIAIMQYKTADGMTFFDESEAIAHEKELLEQYTKLLCGGLSKEQLKVLKMLVDRNTLCNTGFLYDLNQSVSRECFIELDGTKYAQKF